MIDNSDMVGHYFVLVYANTNTIASFQCPTIHDAIEEVTRIKVNRAGKGLPTRRATYQIILGKDYGKLILDTPRSIDV